MPPRSPAILSEVIARPIRLIRMRVRIFAVYLLVMTGPALAAAADWTPLTERLAADGFNRTAIDALFARPEVLFEPEAMAGKLKTLIRSRTNEAASLTSESRKSYHRQYLTRWDTELTPARRTLCSAVLRRLGLPAENEWFAAVTEQGGEGAPAGLLRPLEGILADS